MIDLKALFGEQPPVSTTPAAAPEPLTTTRGEGVPDDIGGPAEATESELCTRVHDLVSDLGDLMMPTGEWDSLPSPTPCPRCGELLGWWDCWGHVHCETCEPSGARSQQLADRAARLRERAR